MSAKHTANPDAVIIGGGPAGSAAAIILARAGAQVVLLERENKPVHKVCGEFLSEEAVDLLGHLGIQIAAPAVPSVGIIRVSKHHRVFETPLPFRAYSLTRRNLDEELLRAAQAAGAQVLRGQSVFGFAREAEGWRADLRSGESISTANVMLATGKHDVAGFQRPPGTQSNLIGLKQYFHLRPEQQQALAASIELYLFPGGYAGLQLVEDGTANLCCAVTSSDLEKGAAMWRTLLKQMTTASSLLRDRLEGAIAVHEKTLAIAPIPYGLVQRETQHGLWLLGDQAAVIPSFTGDGVSMALHSGVLAASALLAGKSSRAFLADYANAVRKQVKLATSISQRMVRPLQQQFAASFLRFAPGALRWLATQTRLPEATRREAIRAAQKPAISAASSSAQSETSRA